MKDDGWERTKATIKAAGVPGLIFVILAVAFIVVMVINHA